jgi:hypothetical protein
MSLSDATSAPAPADSRMEYSHAGLRGLLKADRKPQSGVLAITWSHSVWLGLACWPASGPTSISCTEQIPASDRGHQNEGQGRDGGDGGGSEVDLNFIITNCKYP